MAEREFRRTFGGVVNLERISESALDPAMPRLSLVDEATGILICRFVIPQIIAPGETITLPSIKIRMPRSDE